MKKLVKKIVALGLAVTTTLTLGTVANAVTDYFTGTSGYKLEFKMSVSTSVLSGSAYLLDVNVNELGDKPYYYPSLYVKGVLYGNGSTNSANEQTFKNAISGHVSVSRGTGDCNGKGYGNFLAYGNTAYGDVYGTLYN